MEWIKIENEKEFSKNLPKQEVLCINNNGYKLLGNLVYRYGRLSCENESERQILVNITHYMIIEPPYK